MRISFLIRKDSPLIRQYFNYVYTPVYDFTTARLAAYDALQEMCIDTLDFQNGDRVLCVGIGTGNELLRIFRKNPDVGVTGVDYSLIALKKAKRKADNIEVSVMNAEKLGFRDESSNKVLCIHVTDFVKNDITVTSEIVRVLKKGGNFVTTYPSAGESIGFGLSLLKPGFSKRFKPGKNRIVHFFITIARMFASIVYFPLMFRFSRKSFTEKTLTDMLGQVNSMTFKIGKYDAYHDFIVSGNKTI